MHTVDLHTVSQSIKSTIFRKLKSETSIQQQIEHKHDEYSA